MAQDLAFSIGWWTEPLGSWMAWTRATIAFFLFIGLSITTMGIWEFFRPGGGPRYGILAINTTRGDRLFITLLGSAFIFIGWLSLFTAPLWWPLGLCFVWLYFIFRYA